MSVVCIGGACIDRKYICVEQALQGTSTPARAIHSFGGVARNVAENLARLHVAVSLLTAIGEDENGDALLQDAQQCGIDTSFVIRNEQEATSEYAAIVNPGGELVLGVADMRAIENMTQAQVAQRWSDIEKSAWIFLDCNVSEDVLAYCIDRRRASPVRLAIDTVSEGKVRKLPARLDGIDLLFLNEGEAAAYLRAPANAGKVRERGAGAVVVTRGAEGAVVAADAETEIRAAPAHCVDPTGAGDALVAATLYRLLQGDSLLEAVRVGVIGAALTVESNASVRPDLSAWIAS